MIPSSLAKHLYIRAGKIRGENIDQHLDALKKSQWLSTAELQEIQWRKLVALLNHAFDKSPFYKKRFNEYGITPNDIKTPEDMVKVPLLTKNDIREQFHEMKVTEGSYKFSLAKTSGSTGQALKFYKDRASSGNGRASMYRGHSWYGVEVGDREAKMWGVPIENKEKWVAKVGDYMVNRFRVKSFQLTDNVMQDFVGRMRRFNPKYLMGYSSLVYQFAQYLEGAKIDGSQFALKFVKVTAETLFDDQRKQIETVFNCPVAIEYGATEVGIIAFECPYHGAHIMSESVFVEEIDTGIDSKKEVVITDLNNYYSPIIRYRIGDCARLSDRICRCGRGLPLLEEIVGRTSDVVYKANGVPVHSAIFSYILKDITGRDGGIKQYKIYQEEKGCLRIEIIRSHNYNETTFNHLKKNIYKQLGDNMKLNIVYVDDIQREASGKLRYFVSKVK